MFKFLSEVKAELKHVSWPTKHQAIGYTILVVVISVAVALYLGFFDWLFTYLIKIFVNK
jgi:preprotein translocase subunit SecE